MNKKTKKQIDVLRAQVNRLQQQLSGAKAQCDEPDELEELRKELSAAQAELKRLLQKPF